MRPCDGQIGYIIRGMKPTFHHRVVNGLFEDPVVYLRLLRERRALLFDLGDIWRLHAGELHKVTDVFVTHAHIDHFMGFDRLLRVILRRETPLRLYGPTGITEAVEGKLRGYSWNLIEEYPVSLLVHEVTGGTVVSARFSAAEGFRMTEAGRREDTGVILEEPLFRVRTACLEHDIPVLAYAVEERVHINIDKAMLLKKGLPVGPWLGAFKQAIREGRLDFTVAVSGREYTYEQLLGIVRFSEGQKVSYVVDVSPSAENMERIVELVHGSHTLYIEAFFLEEERRRAVERNHLTARMAGEIAALAGVKEVVPLHLSPKYRAFPERVLEETMSAFLKGEPRATR